jgi:hypothetical protein
MRGLLPSVWLLGAALYTTSILSLTKPFATDDEYWPAPPPVNETVVAKGPLAAPLRPAAQAEIPLVLAAVAVSKPNADRADEWVQVAGYTTVVRSRPSAEAPPLYAYSVGRALRVIAREGHFVRVQDLGSGQLGWIEQASLVPFFGGYRQREPMAQIAVATPPAQVATVAAPPVVADPAPVAESVVATGPAHIATVSNKKPRKPREHLLAPKPGKDAVAANEPVERGLFRKKRGGVQRVALGGKQGGFGGMFGRAFRGF